MNISQLEVVFSISSPVTFKRNQHFSNHQPSQLPTANMVRIASIALFFIASALSVQACTYCQCEFSNGGHCCVYSDAEIGNLDCNKYCANAHRADGTNGVGGPGTACAAGGAYKCATIPESLDRTPCYKQ